METKEYIRRNTRTKTELLTELLAYDPFLLKEVFVDDAMLPHVCGVWLLLVILKFKPEAVNDLNLALAECEDKYARELTGQIRQSLAPIALFQKGFRRKTYMNIIKRHLDNTLAIVKKYTIDKSHVIEAITLSWGNKWCKPKYVHRYDNRVMLDIVEAWMIELLIGKPLVESPPPGFTPQLKVRDGLPSTEWIRFQTTVLEEACGCIDPCAFKALQHSSIRAELGLSIHKAESIAADKEEQLKTAYYKSMNVSRWLRDAYCCMRFYLDGATLPEISVELRNYSETAYEEAKLTLKPYCSEGDKYNLAEAYYGGVPEMVLRQIFTQSTIRKAKQGEYYLPDTKRNYPIKERISEWTSRFAQIVFNISPARGRRKKTIAHHRQQIPNPLL